MGEYKYKILEEVIVSIGEDCSDENIKHSLQDLLQMRLKNFVL